MVPENLAQEMDILISEDGWIMWWGEAGELEALVAPLGEREFDDASSYCG
jgi:hypothetical protein